MSLRVVGAGLGRTGTPSLKAALERLLGAPCYHMAEVFAHPEHIDVWTAAFKGQQPDWKKFLTGYAAEVDWPASAFWFELAEAFPEGDHPALDPRLLRDVVEQRERDDLPRHRRRAAGQVEGHGRGHVRLPLHARHRRPRARRSRRTRSTTPTCARARRSRGWSSTSRATAGSRCARRSACRCRTSPSRTRTRARSSSSGSAASDRRSEPRPVSALLAACGGFLLAVLWMDLIFDVQVLGHRRADGPLPEPVLASIAGVLQARDDRLGADEPADRRGHGRGRGRQRSCASSRQRPARAPRRVRLALCLRPPALAVARVVPNAVRLGSRRDDPAAQSDLARAICRRPPRVPGLRSRRSSRTSSRSVA